MNDYTLTFHTVAYTTRLYIINAEFTFLSTASFAERMHLAVDSPPHKFLMFNASIFLSFFPPFSLSLSLSLSSYILLILSLFSTNLLVQGPYFTQGEYVRGRFVREVVGRVDKLSRNIRFVRHHAGSRDPVASLYTIRREWKGLLENTFIFRVWRR